VWNLLREIAVGEMSYGALGAKLGKRDARDVTKAISGPGALSNAPN
jgi:O6-methylguanine-DNA--protein-cysteine methyltransferase